MKGRILVIDDDVGVRVTVEHVLNAAGYEVVIATDGKQGIGLLDTFLPDVVITDLIMPTQDGMTTIQILKARSPGLKIIAMSGGARIGNDNILQKAKEIGADHIIAKPFEFDVLTKLVESSIEGSCAA
jgi:DNA-binding response OmpR family regulator